MKELYNAEIQVFFEYLSAIKNCYDDGGKSVLDIFSECDHDYESYEEDSFERLLDSAEHVRWKTIYHPDENGQITQECEPDYDIWFMSSRDMTEFYKTLNKLYKEKKISYEEYDGYKLKMYHLLRKYVLHSSTAYYGGASVFLRTKTNHKYASSITIYIDIGSCGSLFDLTCGVATLFDLYSENLKELRKKYYDKDDEYWRRYDWIKMQG